jgi:hypothetical protein
MYDTVHGRTRIIAPLKRNIRTGGGITQLPVLWFTGIDFVLFDILTRRRVATTMKIDYLFLLPDEHPQQVMFLCPLCSRQNFADATAELESLHCRQCGIQGDASEARLEILPDQTRREEQAMYEKTSLW